MPSLQSRIFRLIIKHFVGAKFKQAGRSVPAYRAISDSIIKNQKIPAGTEIWPILINDIPAEWVCAPGTPPEKVVLYLHGGAFIMGSAATSRELAARLSNATKTRLLVLDYRLAPEYPFPAAMQDAIAAYSWLIDSGYSAKQIVIGGESAGGGLALQTLIALRDGGYSLPAAAFFMSPVADWVRFDGQSYITRVAVDPMNTLEMCRFTASHYVGDNDPETALFYPLQIDLSGLPPLCIHVGEDEILSSDSLRLAECARAGQVKVELKTWPGMWHIFQASASFVPEARQSIVEIGHFVLKLDI